MPLNGCDGSYGRSKTSITGRGVVAMAICAEESFPLFTRRETYGRCGLSASYEWRLQGKIQRP